MIGLCREVIGLCREMIGLCRERIGLCREMIGLCRETIVQRDAMGAQKGECTDDDDGWILVLWICFKKQLKESRRCYKNTLYYVTSKPVLGKFIKCCAGRGVSDDSHTFWKSKLQNHENLHRYVIQCHKILFLTAFSFTAFSWHWLLNLALVSLSPSLALLYRTHRTRCSRSYCIVLVVFLTDPLDGPLWLLRPM
jgi:hypothetical protein